MIAPGQKSLASVAQAGFLTSSMKRFESARMGVGTSSVADPLPLPSDSASISDLAL
jgi:hypothetical protein